MRSFEKTGSGSAVLRIAEAAILLGVSTRTIYRAIEAGTLKAVPAFGMKRGRRVLRSDLDAWLEQAGDTAREGQR
jgi:excisionase family DNA binding protein